MQDRPVSHLLKIVFIMLIDMEAQPTSRWHQSLSLDSEVFFKNRES